MSKKINNVNSHSRDMDTLATRRFATNTPHAKAIASTYAKDNKIIILLRSKDGSPIVSVKNIIATREYVKQLKAIHDVRFVDYIESAAYTVDEPVESVSTFLTTRFQWNLVYDNRVIPEYISGDTLLVRAIQTRVDPKSAPAQKLLRDIRAIKPIPSLEAEIIGESARWADITDCATKYLIVAAAFFGASLVFMVLLIIQIKRKPPDAK